MLRGRIGAWLLNRGGVWVAAQTGLMGAVLFFGALWHSQWHCPRLDALGFALLAAAALLGLAGTLSLRGNLSPFPMPAPDARLVQSGIYALIRHPLYTAVIAAAAGWTLLRQSGPALAATVALAVFLDQKARREERWLNERFRKYAAYRRRTWKFLPFIY